MICSRIDISTDWNVPICTLLSPLMTLVVLCVVWAQCAPPVAPRCLTPWPFPRVAPCVLHGLDQGIHMGPPDTSSVCVARGSLFAVKNLLWYIIIKSYHICSHWQLIISKPYVWISLNYPCIQTRVCVMIGSPELLSCRDTNIIQMARD